MVCEESLVVFLRRHLLILIIAMSTSFCVRSFGVLDAHPDRAESGAIVRGSPLKFRLLRQSRVAERAFQPVAVFAW